jgi:hypothetical protein
MVQGVFIPSKPWSITWKENVGKSSVSNDINGKYYLLHIINDIISMISFLIDIIYTCKHRGIIILVWIIIPHEEAWQFIMHLTLILEKIV